MIRAINLSLWFSIGFFAAGLLVILGAR